MDDETKHKQDELMREIREHLSGNTKRRKDGYTKREQARLKKLAKQSANKTKRESHG